MDKSKYNFQKLTPVSDVDLKVYEEGLDFVFDNSDVRNVAISGSYGAGKSSVLESYKKKHPNKRFLHISLAHFKSLDQSDETQTKETILEGKILNQLMHQISADKIPQTKFKVKKKIQTKNIVNNTIFLVMLFLASLHLFMFEKWSQYVESLTSNWLKSRLDFSTQSSSLLVSGLVSAILLTLYIYILVKTQKNRNIFRKINLQGNEIEIFEEHEESYFDKYLNEVLYLFENANADVIVFEDMDRFNASQIFERLREVNTLVNLQLKNAKKTQLRFIYLLRDDIFISKDRTKFFDYILPVVPVVSSSNSYDQFISHFKEDGTIELLDESFLQGLALYTDDMRLLKNLYNEFIVYFNRLNTTELDCNKMLAIVAFKNLFPRDFSNLQLNKGMVFTLFDKKEEFINKEIEKLKEQATKKRESIDLAKEEHLVSLQELDAAYNDKRVRSQNMYNWQEQQRLSLIYTTELAERKEAIENVLNGRLPSLEEELLKIENEIVRTRSKQLKDIITRENIDTIFKVTSKNEIGEETDFSEIKGSDYFDLLKYLIRNGYIDETYADYMTYFYENSLSRVDKTYLRSITDKKAKEFTFQLRDPKKVVERLKAVDFEQEEILNFDLLNYLLQTPDKEQLLYRFIDQLEETRNYKFISGYFETAREMPSFVANLNSRWPEMFSSLIKERAISDKNIRLFSIYTLYYSSKENILTANEDNCLTKYISESGNYLSISDPKIDKLIDGFGLLEVSFINIDYNSAVQELFDAVYKNSLYELNFDNLSLIINKIYLIENKLEIRHKNYTIVMSQFESPLALYVNKNLKKYMGIILANCEGMIEDSEETVILVLNYDDIEVTNEQKNEYICVLKTRITSLNDIKNSSLWELLFENRVILYSEDNIITYFSEKKRLDSTLIKYINSGEGILEFSSYRTSNIDEAEELFDATIVCNELSNNRYREILSSLEFNYNSFNVLGISDEKFQVVIEEEIIKMNLESLKFIRENYPTQIPSYIAKNLNDYVNEITTASEYFNFDEMIFILSWDVDAEIQIPLLKLTNQPVSILHKMYSIAVNQYILKNNLNRNDLINLFASYENWDPSIQGIIYDLAIKNIAHMIEQNSLTPSDKLIRKIFDENNVVENEKEGLFISLIPKMNEITCKEYLNILGFNELIKVFGGGRPKFEVNSRNERILAAFKDTGWIYDFHNDEVDSEKYRIIKRAPATIPD
ncbi:hypothetical protein [Cohnella lupini]|uniref:YobI-like P-loop NTPase domain-containing protein n=1 Tax=Cohnella lupini TaxID=1294267 RepID=A0A3D9I1Q0_9BACL|nr:hypothetical protein [Cohnella lupini]RED55687.1 hypothetical protein DFP95_11613 [Cohnella lupini]